MDLRNTVLGQLLDAPRQADAMAQRAQALQVDPSFWVPGEEPNKFKCLPLWRAICVFKGMDPAHWALISPAAAANLERYTTGEVAARLKELVQLHTLALGGIKMGRLKAVGNEAKGFETDVDSLIEWAVLVGEALPAQRSAPDTTSGQSTPDDQSSDEKMSKRGLINTHKHHWPNIESDIDRAAKNGLAAAKFGQRGWYEAKALKWARSNGKIVESRSPTSFDWPPRCATTPHQ
jgi:hypothetical protein